MRIRNLLYEYALRLDAFFSVPLMLLVCRVETSVIVGLSGQCMSLSRDAESKAEMTRH